MTRIVADGSKSLTVNMHQQGSDYEAGTLYAVLPAGTYHNLKVTLTPVSGDPFTLNSKGEVEKFGRFFGTEFPFSECFQKLAASFFGAVVFAQENSTGKGKGKRK